MLELWIIMQPVVRPISMSGFLHLAYLYTLFTQSEELDSYWHSQPLDIETVAWMSSMNFYFAMLDQRLSVSCSIVCQIVRNSQFFFFHRDKYTIALSGGALRSALARVGLRGIHLCMFWEPNALVHARSIFIVDISRHCHSFLVPFIICQLGHSTIEDCGNRKTQRPWMCLQMGLGLQAASRGWMNLCPWINTPPFFLDAKVLNCDSPWDTVALEVRICTVLSHPWGTWLFWWNHPVQGRQIERQS